MKRIATAIVAVFFLTGAHAQTSLAPAASGPAPPYGTPRGPATGPAPSPPSTYCVSAAAGFLQSDATGYAALSGCNRGDTVIIPGGSTSVVAQVCDFTRSIVAAGGNVVCSIVVPARGRK
jgi:hypothetical protein